MQAPSLKDLDLEMERVRCKCGSENLIFAPAPWYSGQILVAIEPACLRCGAALLPLTVPMGAKWEHHLLAEVPIEIAKAIGHELEDEVTQEGTPAAPAPMGIQRWSDPHEASAAYVTWLGEQEGPPAEDRTRMIQNAALTGMLVFIVLLCVLL